MILRCYKDGNKNSEKDKYLNYILSVKDVFILCSKVLYEMGQDLLVKNKKELVNVLPNTLDAQVGELHLHGVRVDVLCAHAKLASVRNLQIQVQDMYTRVSKCQNIPMF